MADAKAKAQAQTQGTETSTVAAEPGLMDRVVEATRIVEEGRLGLNEEERAAGQQWIEVFIDQATKGTLKRSRNTEASIAALIASLDERISDQLNEFMHAPKFQQLEGSWRGLHYLANQTETSTMLKIKVPAFSRRNHE